MRRVYGNLRRVWSDNIPMAWNKFTRVVSFDFQPDTRLNSETGKEESGYSGFQVEIDKHTDDYGHVKSQLIEAAFDKKDEFGFAMNAIAYLVKKANSDATADMTDANEFLMFDEYRDMCADAAKKVVESVTAAVV